MSTTPVARLRSVCKGYGAEPDRSIILEGINLMMMPGDKASLVGPSGSGKSTLLALLAGLRLPDSGVVEIEGAAIHELNNRDRAELRATSIGIALQSDNLIPFLSAQENVELALAFGGRSKGSTARRQADDLLERLGVVAKRHQYPRQLSGGEAQRVALAVSMANEPSLLLADEVVAQLDGGTAAQVVAEVLTGEFALLYVTHDVALADRVERRYELVDRQLVER